MANFLAEFLGTALLILLGDGVVAGVVLKGTKNENSGWIVITIGWALAVMFAVYAVGRISGAHLNPAVTIALAACGQFEWANVPAYIVAQVSGAMLGAILVWVHYLPHWERTPDPGAKLAVFCTAPAIRHTTGNFISEFLVRSVVRRVTPSILPAIWGRARHAMLPIAGKGGPIGVAWIPWQPAWAQHLRSGGL